MNLSDRYKAALESLVTRITGRYDFAIPYACAVISQNGDGTLELKPDSSAMPGLSNVPIRYGSPGVTATVSAGARCIVAFENADPSRPVVVGWDPTSPLILLNFGGGNQPVARVGDMAQGGGPGQLVYIFPTVPIATPGGPIPTGTPIIGYISFGSTPASLVAGDPLYSVITSGADLVQS